MSPPPSEPSTILSQLQNAGSAYTEGKPGAREQPARAAHCRIAVELKLFEMLKEAETQGISAKDLAAKAGADEVLIGK